MDQDKEAQKGSPEGDDELENLSSDEKAAFEKIMAEIAAATGTPPKSNGDDSAKKSKSGVAATPAPTSVKQTPPVDESQAQIDQIMSDISSQKDASDIPSPAENISASDPPADDLSEDQQAALDQIMAEIGSKRKAEVSPAPSNEPEELSQDQQAALDNIMAEIGSKRKGEKAPEEISADQADDALSADQQAALDSIMAEIGSKRGAEKEISAKDAEITEEKEPPQDDSQADIEKIMAEIEAKKSRDAAPLESQAVAEESSAPPKRGGDNLTMEEFDDELSNLLSSAKNTPAVKPALKTKPVEAPETGVLQPAPAVSSDKAADPPKTDAGSAFAKEGAQAREEYAILKEVSAESAPVTKTSKGSRPGRWQKGGRRKLLTAVAAVMGLVVMAIGGYWGLRHQWRPAPVAVKAATDPVVTGENAKPAAIHTAADPAVASQPVAGVSSGAPGLGVAEAPVNPVPSRPAGSPAMVLSAAKSDLISARQQIQSKISDIQQLKSYYGRGIEEETQKIEDALQSGQIPSFDAALADKKMELAIRSVQRRQSYIAKLDSPLTQLTGMSEQLLFMERRARIYEVLQAGIGGLPIEALKKEADETIGRFLAFNTQMTIDQVDMPPPELETIWAQIETSLKQKANLLAQRAPLNRAIGAEICMGNYERKYLLSALSAETARCLAKWDGTDLFLNSLTELTPEVAQILAQWQGESISLNGVRQLHPEAARHLSQWPGKRMSLNGLSELSPEATAYLSRWKGSQLEMVGLQSIGSWENYGTRLYLSEKLRKQLEAQ